MKTKEEKYIETLKRNLEICKICASSEIASPTIVERAKKEQLHLEFMLEQYEVFMRMKK